MNLKPKPLPDDAYEGKILQYDTDPPSVKSVGGLNLSKRRLPYSSWEPGQPVRRVPFGQLPADVYMSKRFRNLSDSAKLLLLHMLMLFNGHNNGSISLSLMDMRREAGWGSSPTRFAKAVKELRDSKIVKREVAPRQHRAGEFSLAWLPINKKPERKGLHKK